MWNLCTYRRVQRRVFTTKVPSRGNPLQVKELLGNAMFHARPPSEHQTAFFPVWPRCAPSGPFPTIPPFSSHRLTACHQSPKKRNRAPRRRESIDTLTPALDDDCNIAAYLRLCPPTCPTATSKQRGNTTLSLRGSGEGCNKRLPPDREQYIQQTQGPNKPRHHRQGQG